MAIRDRKTSRQRRSRRLLAGVVLVLPPALFAACGNGSNGGSGPSSNGYDAALDHAASTDHDGAPDGTMSTADADAGVALMGHDGAPEAPMSPSPLALGATCAADGDCASHICVNAFCCSSTCSSPCSTCGPNGTCGDILSDAGTTCGTNLTCDGLGNCRRANGQSCVVGSDCSSAHCVLGQCANVAADCSQLTATGLVTEASLVDGIWPQGNPAGQAVLLGGTFDGHEQLCFDRASITASYQDPVNAIVILPADAGVGQHSIGVIATSGAVATMPVNVVSDFGPELTVVGRSTTMANTFVTVNLFGQQATPVVPTPIGNFPPIDNNWDDALPNHPATTWQSGPPGQGNGLYEGPYDAATFGTGMTTSGTALIGRAGIILTRVKGDRYSAAVTANASISMDAGTVSANYVGLFVCASDTPSTTVGSIESGCKEPDGGALAIALDAGAPVIGNPSCQVPCDATGLLKFMMFPDAPSGHQAVLLK